MKKSKFILGFITLATTMTMLTGCGSEKLVDPLNPELISIKDLTSKYTANKPLEITLWTGFGSTMTKAVDSVISSFEEQFLKFLA